jgi:hypothetical protein
LVFCLVFHNGSLLANGSEARFYLEHGQPAAAHAPSLLRRAQTMRRLELSILLARPLDRGVRTPGRAS